MGSISEANLIVKKAVELRKMHPELSAISILDEAMKLSDGYVDLDWESTHPDNPDYVHPDYAYDDIPPAPFAEILRQAFAPDLDMSKLHFQDEKEGNDYAIGQSITDSLNIWQQRVTMPFSSRYGIDGSFWIPCVNIIDKPDEYLEQILDREVWLARFAGHRMTWAKDELDAARKLANEYYIEFSQKDPEVIAHSTLIEEQLARYAYYSTPAKSGESC